MTVMDNLLTGYHPRMKKNIVSIALNLPANRASERNAVRKAHEVLELLNISHLAGEEVSNLSFGYQKMVDIGRAMMADPKMILLDEPVAGMNRWRRSVSASYCAIEEGDGLYRSAD